MIRIAICDDENFCVTNLADIVEQYAQQNNLQVKICAFSSGVALLEKFNGYDLIFLDIDMPEMNGIEVAKVIRKMDKNCKIIYTTNHKDFTHQAFSVRAYGYIVKPFTSEIIENELNDFIVTIKEKGAKQRIVFNGKHSDLIFILEDIYYFEVVGKNIVEVTLNDKKEIIFCSLNDVFEKVKNYSFAIPHQSFIVNLYYVDIIARLEIKIRNGNKIPIAQKRSKEFREQHGEFLQNTFENL